MQSGSIVGITRETEGVGFEPTVGFPTLDFESSALNRTQPPFLEAKENTERPNSNIQGRMQTPVRNRYVLWPIVSTGMGVLPIAPRRRGPPLVWSRDFFSLFGRADQIACLTGQKCYNFSLAMASLEAAYCMSQGQPTLLLVVHYDSQLVCAAVHKYSHLIENSTPPLSP
jgi:hypothetical protein